MPVLRHADDLEQLVESAQTPASAILIVGAPGSGRSTLLDGVRASVSVKTVCVAPHTLERGQPLAGLSLALGALGVQILAEHLAGVTLEKLTVQATLAVAGELVELLRANPPEETLLLVDDADQFDEHSQLALTYLAGRLANTGLRLVMAVTPESSSAVFAGIQSVWVSRLDRDQSMEVARSYAPDADTQTLRMVCDGCSGLPGMIASTLTHLTTDQLQGYAPLALPLYPGRAARLFDSLEPESLRLLQRLSTAPICSLSALPDIQDVDRDRFERLTSQGVLEINGPYVAIRDGALRSSLYWSMSSAQRDALHARAAVEEEGHSRALVLWHNDHSDDAPSSRASLLAEASKLYGQGLVEAATDFVERALLLEPTPEELVKELLALCNRLIILSEFGLSRRYLKMCRRSATRPRQRAECLRLEVTISSLADEPIDVAAIDVYANRYRKESPRTSAELLAFAAVSLAAEGDLTAARGQIERAYEIRPAGQVRVDSVQNWARRYLDALDGRCSEPIATIDSEADVEELPTWVQFVSGRALMHEERYDRARYTFRSLALEAPRRGRDVAWNARVLALSAYNEILAGNIPEASRMIDLLAELGPAQTPRHLLLFAWNESTVRDRADGAALLAEARERISGSPRPVLIAQLAALEGSFALMHGDLDVARLALARAYDLSQELRPGFLRMEANFVEVLARSGEWEAARHVTSRLAERALQHPSRWCDIALARCEAIVAPDHEVLARFQDAIAIAKKWGATLELGRARMNFAMALDRFGQAQRGSDLRKAAEYTFESVSAAGWVSAVRNSARLIERPLQTSLLSTLTDSELAVLRLMHKGVRNKDIAAALFISLRTVEVRITQIYRKLEARSRSHLLTLLPAELDQIDSF